MPDKKTNNTSHLRGNPSTEFRSDNAPTPGYRPPVPPPKNTPKSNSKN